MTYRGNALLRQLDRLVQFTGVQARMAHPDRNAHIPFRFAPLLLLALAGVGMFMQVHVPQAGWLMIMVAWLTAVPLWLSGPLHPQPHGARDERERALLRLGHFAGLAAVALAAVAGCFLFGVLGVLAMLRASVWLPRMFTDWFALGFLLLVLHSCGAVLAVSWAIPRMPSEDEG